MFDIIENLKISSVLHKVSRDAGKVDGRRLASFNIRVTGTMKYSFAGKELVASEGEMIFLPKGCSYEYKNISGKESMVTVINIEGDFGECKPFVCSVKDFYDVDSIMYNMADMFKFGSVAQKYQCLSLLYGLLSYISNIESREYEYKKKFLIIEPAMVYLKRHIYDPELQIERLHMLCGISHTYFSRIFIKRFGTSPKNYVTGKRLSYAKSIIDSGEFNTVKELAYMAGYKDPLYFGKVFKKHYGASPVNMNRQ